MSWRPWTKALVNLNRYDWFTAVCLHPVYGRRPALMTLANAIHQHVIPELDLSVAGQKTLREWCGVATEAQVRTHIAALERPAGGFSSGALLRVARSDLDESSAERLNKVVQRTARARYYKIDKFWAAEVLEWHAHRLKFGNAEPAALRKWHAENPGHRPFAKDTETVRTAYGYTATDCVRFNAYGVRTAITNRVTNGVTIKGPEGEKDITEDSRRVDRGAVSDSTDDGLSVTKRHTDDGLSAYARAKGR